MRAEQKRNDLQLLSVVIPARDEEACIASTVEHLHLELRLHDVPHEIVVVDDGSSDRIWQILEQLKLRLPNLADAEHRVARVWESDRLGLEPGTRRCRGYHDG
jgi:glycosyltransferase involved in cell wall biosynthesis